MNEWERREAVTHALGDAIPAGANWERRSAARPGDLRGDLVLPLGQSLVTGLVGGLVGGILGGWTWAAVAAVAAFGLAWLVLLAQTRQGLSTVEWVTGQDPAEDHIINPGAPARSVRIELAEQRPGGGRLRFLDLPITEARLSDVARAVLEGGANFSRPGLAGVLSQNEYHKLAKAMLAAGLLVDVGGNRRELSAAGRALLRRVLG